MVKEVSEGTVGGAPPTGAAASLSNHNNSPYADYEFPTIPLEAINVVTVDDDVVVVDQRPPPTPRRTVTLELTAPTDLQAGYEFDVDDENDASGRTVRVQVPHDVSAGERFHAHIVQDEDQDAQHEPSTPAVTFSNIPRGHWRDHWWDCCTAHGCCHPSCCFGFLFPLILLGQVLQRYNLDCLVRHHPSGKIHPCRTMSLLTFLALVLMTVPILSLFAVLGFAAGLCILGSKTRYRMRRQHHIPSEYCYSGGSRWGGDFAEDACCMCWCSCCSIAQMARHSVNYNHIKAEWFARLGCNEERYRRYHGGLPV